MAQEKTLGFSVVINGISNENIEMQKLNIQLSNLNKEYKDLQKTIKDHGGLASNQQLQQLAAYSKEINNHKDSVKELNRVMDSAPDSLNRMRAELIKLKDEYANASGSVREQMVPAIKKLNDEVSKSEQAIGTYSRNVGNYSSAFKDVGEKIMSMAGPAAVVAAGLKVATFVFEGLKEAIMSTTSAINALNIGTAVTKQMFYDLVQSGKINTDNMEKVAAATDKLNKLRVGEYKDQFEISKLNKDLQEQRLLASDQTLDLSVKLEALNKVRDLENQEVVIKIGHLKEELAATLELQSASPKNEALQAKAWALATAINDTYAESDRAMKRVETTRTGYIKKEAADRQKEYDDLMKLADEQIKINNAEAESFTAVEERVLKAKVAITGGLDKKKSNPIMELFTWKASDQVAAVKYSDKVKENLANIGNIYDKANANIEKDQKDHDRAMLDMEKKTAESKMNIANSAVTLLTAIAGKSKSIQKAALIAERAVAIAEIITKARIANMATTAWGAAYAIPTFGASMIAAIAINAKNTIAEVFNIGAIVAATATGLSGFARGGKINRGVSINTGTVDDTLIAVNKTETVLTQRHVAALGGSGAMHRIGVPGYASGGYVGQQATAMPPSEIDYDKLAEANRRYLNVVLDINKLNQAQNELAIINLTNRI